MHRGLVCTLVALLAGGPALSAVPAGARSNQQPLRILVTNDDGVTAPGIGALVEGLRKIPGVKVTVVAPADNRSRTGSTTSPGELVTTKTKTARGYPAIAVTGFPVDTIVHAIDRHGVQHRPDLVVSGINAGPNLGRAANRSSGTVAAAKAAARRGIPALAVSQGTLESGEPDYPAGVKQALMWLERHRESLTPKSGKAVEVVLDNLNVPSCGTDGEIRGVVEVPLATSDTDGAAPPDCASTAEDLPNDIEAFHNGFVTLTQLPGSRR